jgi:hypothetical protein
MNVRYTEKNPPADVEKITCTAQQLSINPDSWITRFWWSCDGAMIEDLVKIYSTDEIAERQQTYEIAEYFPGYLLIGDDSGGRLILVDRSAIERFYLLDSGCPSITDGLAFSSMDAVIKEVVG